MINLYKSPKDDFEYLNFLGKEAFGQVFQVKKMHGKDKNRIYAMKSISKYSLVKNNKSISHALTELNIMKTLKHPFLVELMYAFQEETKIYLVLEYLSGGTLHELLKETKYFSEQEASFYMKELILAIEFLHSHNVIHRDIKPQNVLLDSTGHIKLSDLGLAKDEMTDEHLTRTICGSPAYMAPEIQNPTGYGKTVDWWSLGVVFYKLITGQKPFKATNFKDLRLNIRKGHFIVPTQLPLAAQHLLRGLINIDPNKRLGAHEIKNHIFFQSTVWNYVAQRLESPSHVTVINIKNVNGIPANEIPANASVIDIVKARNNDVFKEFNFVNPKLIDEP